jgi:hypothetical protein
VKAFRIYLTLAWQAISMLLNLPKSELKPLKREMGIQLFSPIGHGIENRSCLYPYSS